MKASRLLDVLVVISEKLLLVVISVLDVVEAMDVVVTACVVVVVGTYGRILTLKTCAVEAAACPFS